MKDDQLSQTASFVAIKFYGLTRIESFRSLFDDSIITYYEQLIQDLPAPFRYYHYWLKFRWVQQLYIWAEELLLPGDLLHVIARKWYIQRMVDNILDKGYEQLIVLGGGFDHLAFYYSSQSTLACYEVDTPYMAEQKRNFLQNRYDGEPQPEIIDILLPDDQLGQLFSDHPEIDPHKKTIIVAEGFFDYLSPDTVTNALKGVKDFFSHTPTLISTHFALDELPLFRRQVFKLSVKLVGEELQLKTSMDTFKQYLSDIDYNIRQLHDCQEIRKKITDQTSTTLPLLDGFYLFMAE